MKFPALVAILLAGAAISACAPRYYDGYYDGYYTDRYYGPYGDRYDNRYNGPDGDRAPAYYGDGRDHY